MIARRLLAIAMVVAAVGCGKGDSSAGGATSTEPLPLAREHECAACGMIVVDQSAPRAQLVHRDGTRQRFCSIGDLLAYLDAPSPHGAVVAIYVELQDPAADPREFSVAPRPWSAAERAFYVVGIDKPRVMGEPVMVYASEAEARAVAERYGGRAIDWDAVRERKPGR
jgi:nitrous oxide reductase accessory protein NosL